MGCILGKEQPQQHPATPVAVASVRNLDKSAAAALNVSSGRRSNASAKEVTNGELSVKAPAKVEKGNIKGRGDEKDGKEGKAQGGDHREHRRKERHPNPRLSNPPKHVLGEQVAAGWPPWLSEVAGEAIKGLIPRRADSYQKLQKIGQGTYSNVYKARDLHSGKIVALKKVRFDNLEPESVKFMAREILVLRRLDHPNIVKFEGLVTSRMSCSLYLVFEYMEHDLAGLAASPGIEFTEAQVKCYMKQLLSGLEHCHTNGVLHRDIKGSNLLLDNGGILKIADFGLAASYDPKNKQPMTSRVVTLWYRAPELLLGVTHYGVGVDLWSVGCILAELFAGRPILPGRTEVEQMHRIFKLCGSPPDDYWKKIPHESQHFRKRPYKRCIRETFKDFSPSALSLIETLLSFEPDKRGTASAALNSEFFRTEPLACDPSSLPQYPPSKELDAKLRDKETRRQRAGQAKGHANQARNSKKQDHSGRAVPAPEANVEIQANIQKRRIISRSSGKSKSGKFPPPHKDGAVGFPMAPSRHEHPLLGPQSCPYSMGKATSYSGPLGNPATVGPSQQRKHNRNRGDGRVIPDRGMRSSKGSATARNAVSKQRGKQTLYVNA
eukprot:TRINITY_DN4185_c0_g1_i5.p1 TRINITY_DN4185_c0_g1~~TRINITY_DN4185_c0_g1_i5.p1  ORF type:complete len:608 (-),score=117.55 TRINITY_DN4185_c0_g1_i5:212-2035(-)